MTADLKKKNKFSEEQSEANQGDLPNEFCLTT